MTALQRNKLLSALLTGAIIGVVFLGASCVYLSLNYNSVQADFIELEQTTAEVILAQKVAHASEIAGVNQTLQETEQALRTALEKNEVVLTLTGKTMGEWTVEEILKARDMFDLIPYGSWFEHGHIVTGSYGSTALSGSFWKDGGHGGADIFPKSGRINEIILSVIDGRVKTWGRNDRVYGNYLVIETLDGMFEITLAHLDSIAIFSPDGNIDLYEGMEFKRGDRIAKMGNTGKTTGNENEGHHLHVEYKMRTADGYRLLNADTIINYMGNIEGELN